MFLSNYFFFLRSFIYHICTRPKTQFRGGRFENDNFKGVEETVPSLKSIIDYRDSLIVGASGHSPLGGSVAHWAGRLLDSYNTDR